MACQWHIDECNAHWIAGWIDDDGPVDLIEITVNGHSVAQISPNAYRHDLAEAGIGDGRRSFSVEIWQYLDEPDSVVEIRRGAQVLHSATLRSPIAEAIAEPRPAGGIAVKTYREVDVLFLQTADLDRYRRLLEITSRTVTEYCARQRLNYQSYVGICRGYYAWQATYNRIPLLRDIANSGFRGWVCYMDADAFIADLDFDLVGYLADKAKFAFIAATDSPQDPNRPYWLVNAGTFLVNLASPVGRRIIEKWSELFDGMSDEQLRAMAEWSESDNDQNMLQRILRDTPEQRESILILRDEPNLINYHSGKFIKQILRANKTLEERIEYLQSETDLILGVPGRQTTPLTADVTQTTGPSGGKTLTDLANQFGSDKGTKHGSPPHKYTYLYDLVLARYRSREINLLELGLAGGGPEVGGPRERTVDSPSVQMWLEYFAAGHVFGFDVSDFSHIRHPRFTFIRGDLGSEADLERVAQAAEGYDIVMDDASHASWHQQLAFKHLFPRLRDGGSYIIEDLHWQSPFYEGLASGVPTTADFMIAFFENGEYLANPILSEEFMNAIRRETGSFAWFPSFSGEASRPRLVVLTKTVNP